MSVGRISVVLSAIVVVSGCRTATHVTEVPRVDLELSGGNRGYLVGTPPEAAQLKTTRQLIQTDIEIPSYYKPKRGTAAPEAGASEFQAAKPESGAIAVGGKAAPTPEAGPVDTYVVQKGESLWTIAAKPEIYGKASRWRRLLDANHDLLKGNPNRLRAGMTLKIPRGKSKAVEAAYGSDAGTTFKK